MSARVGAGQSDVEPLIHVWVEKCYEMSAVSSPRWIIDAGANVGYATRWFAERYPGANVIAIEPERANVDLLRSNTYGLANVHIVEGALAATSERRSFADSGLGPWAFRVGDAASTADRLVGEVDCVTIDELLERFGIERIDLLKIDIEGSELEVLADSAAWMPKVEALAVELHDRYRPGCTRSFIDATTGFAHELVRGENFFVWR